MGLYLLDPDPVFSGGCGQVAAERMVLSMPSCPGKPSFDLFKVLLGYREVGNGLETFSVAVLAGFPPGLQADCVGDCISEIFVCP